MKNTGNVILITGGGSGIGRGLAEAFHRLGNTVIIAGRRENVLRNVILANPGMTARSLDIEYHEEIKSFAAAISAEFPYLNTLINAASFMKTEDLRASSDDLSVVDATISTNLLGTIRLTTALLPLLRRQSRATIITVSSGRAFLPIATHPTYCAAKAAIHSWTQSLRYQITNTAVDVLELIPPRVQTEVGEAVQGFDPAAMPLGKFVSEAIELLQSPPESGEILVEPVIPERIAERIGKYDLLYGVRNEQAAQRAALTSGIDSFED